MKKPLEYVRCTKCKYVGMVPFATTRCPHCQELSLIWVEGQLKVYDTDELPEGIEAICETCGAVCDYHSDVCLCETCQAA